MRPQAQPPACLAECSIGEQAHRAWVIDTHPTT